MPPAISAPSVLEWRSQVAAGTLLGPTIYTSGPKLEGIDSIWPGDLEVGSEADVRAALDPLQAMRVDFVKITENTLTPALYLYGLGQARQRGFTVSAHVPVALTLDQVSEAGLGSIEHMSYLLRGGSPREAELSAAVAAGRMSAADAVTAMIDGFDEATALATFGRLAARGTAVTPTLNGSRILAYLDRDTHVGDDYLKYIGPGLQATYEGRVTRAAADDAAAVARRHARFEKSATPGAAAATGRRHAAGRHRCRLPQLVQLPRHRPARRAGAAGGERPHAGAGAAGVGRERTDGSSGRPTATAPWRRVRSPICCCSIAIRSTTSRPRAPSAVWW